MVPMVVFGVALLVAVLLPGLAARTALCASSLFLAGGALASDGFPGLIHITPDGGIASVAADLAFFAGLFITIGGSMLLLGASAALSGVLDDIPVTPLRVVSAPRPPAMARWPSPPACSTARAGRGPGVSLRRWSDVGSERRSSCAGTSGNGLFGCADHHRDSAARPPEHRHRTAPFPRLP